MNSPDNREKQQSVLRLHVERPIYDQESLNREYHFQGPQISILRNISHRLKGQNVRSCASSMFPVVRWMRKYKWKESIVPDMISGLTVAIMHIPQGMAYALLGNLPPVVGIYMAFFPVLAYFFFGTSKHVSMGTFAIVCLMTGKSVVAYGTPLNNSLSVNNTHFHLINSNNEIFEDMAIQYSPMQVATAVTFMVGILQMIMYVFRLGIISTLLSETLVNGFTTGAAIHVLMSQIKDLLGLKLPKHNGDHFKFIHTAIDIFEEIPNTNIAAVIISAISIIIMYINNEWAKPWLKKMCSMPFPIEMIAVVTGTLVSKYGQLPEIYNIRTVGHIPTGLPKPELPTLQLLPLIALDSVSITMVSYTITLSMALIFAQKLNYEIDSNQELFAMGVGNLFGSFFSCMPVSASLSRSLIQQTVGGKTQIASVVSCGLLLIILLWIGPFFEPLPRCVLASIIVVALKGMLMQAKQLPRFWKLSKLDGMVWIVTLLTVVIVGIDIGLLVGLLTSLASILLLTMEPYMCLLGHVPNTDLYLDVNRYEGTMELRKIKILHYCGGLNFANSNHFKSKVLKLVGVEPHKIVKQRLKMAKRNHYDEVRIEEEVLGLRCIIMDMSALSYVDPSGIAVLHSIADEYARINVSVYLAGCSWPVFERIIKCDKYAKGEHSFRIFATIHDAVTYSINKFTS
ncbi:solute carrier family 26 member 6 [Venturia canescens]|uniref:solute carrier family 26 member 6 n=1 Tax=Venturia canescens TaxID=32260 RepID=UPI001C9D0146|nr:solute carrier family 26 member 6 [Venturia canescens]